MKQIFDNSYITVYKFRNATEQSKFIANQKWENILSLEEEFGNNYYCYVCHNSLKNDKKFIIKFSSDKNESELYLLNWPYTDLIVLETGKALYLIDDNLNIKAYFELVTPLIGLHLTSSNNLLILEEAELKLVNTQGGVLLTELFDLIENFSIANDLLLITTGEGKKSFQLR